jgi:hypothetical protein
MKTFEAVPALNRLLNLLCRSLPVYLADARPWTLVGRQQKVQAALDRLVSDQCRYAARVARAISERGGLPNPGRFRLEFAAKNDLSLDYLVESVIESEEQDMELIDGCVADLEAVPDLHALAEEVRGNIRGHLDILRQMLKDE